MYALIIVIGMLSQGAAGSAVIPVGVTSQIVGKFKNLDECKAAAKSAPRGRPCFGSQSVNHLGSQLVLCIHRRDLTQYEFQGETRRLFGTRAPAEIHRSVRYWSNSVGLDRPGRE